MVWPEEGFDDLFRGNFINAAGQVSRQKLERLKTGPYQRALLKRGVTKRPDVTGGEGVYNQWIHCDLIVIFKQFIQPETSGYMLSSLKMYSPL